MTSEQQRLHEQHKARLARIQSNAVRPPEPVKPATTPRDKFYPVGRGFPRVGNLGARVGSGIAPLEGNHTPPEVSGEHAAPTTRTPKSAAAGSASWFHIAGTHLTVRDIRDAVIAYFRMSRVELFAKRRSKATVRRRHIAIYLSKILTIQSLPEIGMRFGGLDHTTILYASRKIERELPLDADLARDVAEIERTLAELNEFRANEARAS